MTQKIVGYVNLEWTCPKCQSRNPGEAKTCNSCGAPQPENVQFEQAQGVQISQDENIAKVAEAGADIHCPFCGTRNPAGTEVCSQCGGDLKEGAKREAGQVIGAFAPGPVPQVKCPNCNSNNPETNLKCANCGAPLAGPAKPVTPVATAPAQPNWLIIALVILMALCACGGIFWFMNQGAKSEEIVGGVRSVQWQTVVPVLGLAPVQRQAWYDQIPNEAQVGDCRAQVRYTTDQQPGGGDYQEVCGTPYTVDTGSGVGRVVQDCRYQVLEDYCEYTFQEWAIVNRFTEQGNDVSPFFAQPQLAEGQRLGERQAQYVVVFETNKGTYTYPVSDLETFQHFQVGSEWVLIVNGFNQIVGIEPASAP